MLAHSKLLRIAGKTSTSVKSHIVLELPDAQFAPVQKVFVALCRATKRL
jgi:hypothetical protein